MQVPYTIIIRIEKCSSSAAGSLLFENPSSVKSIGTTLKLDFDTTISLSLVQ